jgi:hypothetical protein
MQQAIFQQATVTQFQTQASRVLPGHGAGLEKQAANDESSQDESSLLRLVFSVLVNVIGGTILLSAMFVLPHLIASILS